jgi:8-oxo-dGTP diphosphatase
MLPRVGVGALIHDDAGNVLLIQRRRAPEAGCWSPVGGKPNWLEPLQEAVQREVLEEIGVEIHLERLLVVCDHIIRDEGQHWVAPIYLARIVRGEPRNLEPDAIEALGWFARATLPTALTLTSRAALEAYWGGEP